MVQLDSQIAAISTYNVAIPTGAHYIGWPTSAILQHTSYQSLVGWVHWRNVSYSLQAIDQYLYGKYAGKYS